jgi:hypothetical protein
VDRVAARVELRAGGIDVGRLDAEPHRAALLHVLDDLVCLVHFRREQRGHELDGIVGLEIRGLVRDVRVARGVGLVEPVARELLDQVPDPLALASIDLVGLAAGDELLTLLRHQLAVLLPHRLAERIGFSERESGEIGGQAHHLLLVDHHAVGLLQMPLHQRMLVGDGSASVLPVDEIVDEIHRSRSVERDHRDDVLEALRAEPLQGIAHPRRLQLEDPERPSFGEELEGLRVVERQVLRIDPDPSAFLDQSGGVRDDGQRLQSQEVHLEQPELLDRPHGEARDQLRPLGVLVERHALHEGLVGDHHRRRVHRRVSSASFEGPGNLPELVHLRIPLHLLRQQRRLFE